MTAAIKSQPNALPDVCKRCKESVPLGAGLWRPTPEGRIVPLCGYCSCFSAPLGGLEQRLEAYGDRLRPYQREGARWLAGAYRTLLGDQQGLGKTVQALAAIPEGNGCLVLCPATAKGNWYAEAGTWRSDLGQVSWVGRARFEWPGPGQFAALSYDSVPREDLGQQLPPLGHEIVIVADEAHLVRNKNKRQAAFVRLCDAVLEEGGRVWLMTATSIMNHPRELYQILDTIKIADVAFNGFGRFESLFRSYYKHRVPPSGWRLDEIRKRIAKVRLRRKREDVLPELPTKWVDVHHVQLKKSDYKAIHEAVTHLVALHRALRDAAEGVLPDPKQAGISREERTARWARVRDHAAGILPRLVNPSEEEIKQAVTEALNARSGATFDQMSRIRSLLSLAKIAALVELVEGFEHASEPLVVFSAHRPPIDVLSKRHGWARISGSDSPKQRTEAVAAFQAGELDGLAITIGAGATAITLTRAANVVFVDLDWTPSNNDQAEDRLCRWGQTRKVRVIRMLADHAVDELVWEKNDEKLALIQAVDDML